MRWQLRQRAFHARADLIQEAPSSSARRRRDQWGPTSVPVCEAITSANHFTILHGLADPNGQLHRHALALLGLKR
jgi:hypothetical protein